MLLLEVLNIPDDLEGIYGEDIMSILDFKREIGLANKFRVMSKLCLSRRSPSPYWTYIVESFYTAYTNYYERIYDETLK